jgi:hypothetical protein
MGDPPKSGDQGQVEVEDILQPFYGRGGLVGEHSDEVGSGLVTS